MIFSSCILVDIAEGCIDQVFKDTGDPEAQRTTTGRDLQRDAEKFSDRPFLADIPTDQLIINTPGLKSVYRLNVFFP